MRLGLLFFVMAVFCFFNVNHAQASGLWTCDLKVKAVGNDEITVVKASENKDGPCSDYKVGQTYNVSSLLTPSHLYDFSVAVTEHAEKDAGNNGAQWFIQGMSDEAADTAHAEGVE